MQFKLSFEARHGLIQSFALDGLPSADTQVLSQHMPNKNLWEMGDWVQHLRAGGLAGDDASLVGEWMNSVLGKASR